MSNQSSFSIKKVLNIISKIISWAVFVILLIAALFLIYYYIATKVYAAKGAGYEPKFSIYTIISPSMTPKIKVYDTIVNVRVDNPTDIEVGDVITFISTSLLTTGTTITHRVIAITEEDGQICYQTKGDYNNIADQACARFNNVIGKVVFKIPQLGRIQFFLASKAGWLLCILIPALFIIGRDIMRIVKLSTIKKNVNNINNKGNKNSQKSQMQEELKLELKRKFSKYNYNDNNEYYQDPEIITIDKKK